MNYLLTNLKVTARGESLEVGKNELVFDPDSTHKFAELKAIAKANNIEHGSKIRMTELVKLIKDTFEAKSLPEVINITAIVTAGVEANKSDDEIMQDLVDAGVHFRNVLGQFRTAMMAAGYMMRPAERNKKLAELLVDFDPITGVDVTNKAKALTDEVPRTSERQAMAAIRLFAKDNKIELPKVHKIGGWRKKLHNWIVENPTASVSEMGAYIAELGRPDTITRRYTETMLLVNRVAERLTTE